MAKHSIRQSTVIQGSGPGSLSILKEGLSVVMPGLDSWYRKEAGISHSSSNAIPDMRYVQDIPEKCKLVDANLAEALNVEFFAYPPAQGADFATKRYSEHISASVFPTWTICYNCRSLGRMKKDEQRLPLCASCENKEGKKRRIVQVNFIIVCEDGHIDEFPWSPWVHKTLTPRCDESALIMESSGSGDLRGQRVTCTKCNAKRTLAGTNEASTGQEGADGDSDSQQGTYLSNQLTGGETKFLCAGSRPWLDDHEVCQRPVRLILRNATNLYYSNQVSSILIPRFTEKQDDLDNAIEKYYLQLDTQRFMVGDDFEELALFAEFTIGLEFRSFKRSEIAERLKQRFTPIAPNQSADESITIQSLEVREWNALRTPIEHEVLRIRTVGYSNEIDGVVNIHAVPTLTKTTTQTGFSRLMPRLIDLANGKKLLSRNWGGAKSRWLPAVRYVGEGIFIEFDQAKLQEWEQQPLFQSRIEKIESRLIDKNRANPDAPNTPRRVLLHTLAHLLIQQLVNDCGYIAAALMERIYVSNEMAGILIYTAAADTDGTMGGLVELARPDSMKTIFEKAVESAQWCSNDPVCMELGKAGQGIFGTNLAACHNCCLLPETACQHFNQGLDRATLVGDTTAETGSKGFFA